MSEIKVGSKVRSLFRTGPFAGLEGKVTKIEKPWEDVELPEGFAYMGSRYPIIHFDVDGRIYSGESYTLECLDPEPPTPEIAVGDPVYIKLSNGEWADRKGRITSVDGDTITFTLNVPSPVLSGFSVRD